MNVKMSICGTRKAFGAVRTDEVFKFRMLLFEKSVFGCKLVREEVAVIFAFVKFDLKKVF